MNLYRANSKKTNVSIGFDICIYAIRLHNLSC